MESVCARHANARIATVCGRYYAMDRDRRYERLQPAYEAIVDGVAPFTAGTAHAALAAAYARGESDEFVQATTIVAAGAAPARIADGDVAVFMNFRADRARQLTRALTDPAFDGFARKRIPRLARFVTLTSYGDDFRHLGIAFAPQAIGNSFGEYIARLGLHQLRIAETEKYAHVTYFFNGGTESVYAGEDRILVPSPKVATYDLRPEMSAGEVTDRLVAAIEGRRYDAIVCNYANGDMLPLRESARLVVGGVDLRDARPDAAQRERRASISQRRACARTRRAHPRHALPVLVAVVGAKRAQRQRPGEIAGRPVVRGGLGAHGRIDAVDRAQIAPPARGTLRPIVIEARRQRGLLDEARSRVSLAALLCATREQQRRNAVVRIAPCPIGQPVDRVARRLDRTHRLHGVRAAHRDDDALRRGRIGAGGGRRIRRGAWRCRSARRAYGHAAG